MARLQTLKGIVDGLAGSFVSRNNDIGGYWALGLLKAVANEHCTDGIRICLVPLDPSCAPRLQEVAQTYRSHLERILTGAKLDLSLVAAAEIFVTFRLGEAEADRVPLLSCGAPLRVEARIVDRRSRVFTRTFYSCCAEHDPRRERRSLRTVT